MNKISLLTATMLLCASTSFAFTNEYAGYTLNNNTPDVVFQSANIYGYMNVTEKNMHIVSHFNPLQMSGIVGQKYTSAYFDKVYSDLKVLKGNEANEAINRITLLNLDNYAKVDANNKAILEKSMQTIRLAAPQIKLGKVAGKKAITMSTFFKQDSDLACCYVTLVNANDNMYILVSGGPLEQATPSKANKAPAKPELKTDKLKDLAKAPTPVPASKVAPELVTKATNDHNKFLKLFKPIAPVSQKVAPVFYTDSVTAKTVKLPSDWGYGQFNFKDAQKPITVTAALPTDILSKISAKLLDKKVMGEQLPANESELLNKLGPIILAEVKDIVITGSYKLAGDKDIAAALANPDATKLQLDTMFKLGLKEAAKMGGPFMKLNHYKFNNDIDKNLGVITLNADVTLLRKVDFLNRIKIMGNSQIAVAAWQLHNKAKENSPEASALYEEWQF